MKSVKYLIILLIIPQLIEKIHCDKVQVVNLNAWSLSNQNGSESTRQLFKTYDYKSC